MDKNTNITLKWAIDYIDYFNKNIDFDPFQVITGNLDKKHKLYIECVDLLETVTSAVDDFRKNRDIIAL